MRYDSAPSALRDCSAIARDAIAANQPVYVTNQCGEGTGHLGLTFFRDRGLSVDETTATGLPDAVTNRCGFDDCLDTPLGPVLLGYVAYLGGRLWQMPSLEAYFGSAEMRDHDPVFEADARTRLREVASRLPAALQTALPGLEVRTFLVEDDGPGDRHTLQVCIPCDAIAAGTPDYRTWRAQLAIAFAQACGEAGLVGAAG